jgi:hypothetical protein
MNIKGFVGSLGAVASLALVAGACGDDKKGGGSITVDTVALEYGKAFCEQMIKCASPANEDMALLALFAQGAPEECAEFASRIVPKHFTEDIAANRVVMDGAKLRQCFDQVADTCGSDPTSLPVCREALVGQVATGGACIDDMVCAGDAFCKRDGDWNCPGTCQPRVAIGQPCTDYQACSQLGGAAECDYGNDVCKATPAPVAAGTGEECGWVLVEGSYTEYTCPSGQTCTWDGETTSVCAPIIPSGGSCEGIGDCAFGTVCQDQGDGPKCQPVALVSTAGAACNEEEEPTQPIAACNRLLGLYCKGGTCASTDGKVGSACNEEMYLMCDVGLFCDDEDSQTCKQLKPDNGSCVEDYECQSEFCNDEGKCGAPVCE